MITEKQYKKALDIVRQYQEQLNKRNVTGTFKISLSDIIFGTRGLHCEKITNLNDEQLGKLEDDISEIVGSVEYANIEEMGYLVIEWKKWNIDKKDEQAVCEILNCL